MNIRTLAGLHKGKCFHLAFTIMYFCGFIIFPTAILALFTVHICKFPGARLRKRSRFAETKSNYSKFYCQFSKMVLITMPDSDTVVNMIWSEILYFISVEETNTLFLAGWNTWIADIQLLGEYLYRFLEKYTCNLEIATSGKWEQQTVNQGHYINASYCLACISGLPRSN